MEARRPRIADEWRASGGTVGDGDGQRLWTGVYPNGNRKRNGRRGVERWEDVDGGRKGQALSGGAQRVRGVKTRGKEWGEQGSGKRGVEDEEKP